MGAWGEGPLQSDGALDAVYEIESELRDDPSYKSDPVKFVREFFENEVEADNEIVLAGAAWFLFNGYDVSPFRERIDIAIDEEIRDAGDMGWEDPESRFEAMELFRDQLDGKEVDPTLVDKYDMTLAEKAVELLSEIGHKEQEDGKAHEAARGEE